MSTTRSPPFRGVPMSTRYSLTGAAALAHLVDERQQRAAERHEIGERMTPEHVGGRLEEGLRRRIGLDDVAIDVDEEDGMRQRIEKRARQAVRAAPRAEAEHTDVHAALLFFSGAETAAEKRRITSRGRVSVRIAARRPRVASPALVEVPAEMLPRGAHAEDRAVVLEHRLVVATRPARPAPRRRAAASSCRSRAYSATWPGNHGRP